MNRAQKYHCISLYPLILILAAVLSPQLAFAASDGGQSLDQAANDPTASLMNIQVQNLYSGDYHLLANEAGNTLLLRSAIPFKTGDIKHIARATLPLITNSPSGESGVGDLVLFDLLVSDQPWGRWGAGAVLLAPTASNDALGAEKWGIGPAIGFVAREPGFMWGAFNQNIFSFAGNDARADVNISIVQPIVNYSLPNKWSIGTSEMNITYDWDQNDWTALPLGIKLSKLHKFDKLPVQFSGSYETNFADDYISPKWTLNLGMKFLFPI